MNWNKYFKEKDAFKRYEMLEKENRLSYDHVDNWLMSLKDFLSKPQASATPQSPNNNFTAHSDSPKVCPRCKGKGERIIKGMRVYCAMCMGKGSGKPS